MARTIKSIEGSTLRYAIRKKRSLNGFRTYDGTNTPRDLRGANDRYLDTLMEEIEARTPPEGLTGENLIGILVGVHLGTPRERARQRLAEHGHQSQPIGTLPPVPPADFQDRLARSIADDISGRTIFGPSITD